MIRDKKHIKITAHSGCEKTENNSLEYLEKAIQLPCDVIEIDVRMIRNKLYLTHNKVNKTDDLLSYEDAVDVLQLAPEKQINCDLKEEGILNDVSFSAEVAGLLKRTIFTGSIMPSDFPLPEKLKGKVFLNLENLNPNLSSVTATGTYTAGEVKQAIEKAAALGAAGINVEYTYADQELIEYAHDLGLQVFVWTLDREEDMQKMITRGVDSITTYEVLKLKKML